MKTRTRVIGHQTTRSADNYHKIYDCYPARHTGCIRTAGQSKYLFNNP